MSKDNVGQFARDPLASAVLTKVTSPSAAQGRNARPDGGSTPLRTELAGIAGNRIRTGKNAIRIYEALPEMETIVTIAVSSIMSTKDLVNANLIYGCENEEIPLKVREALNRLMRAYFSDFRKLPKKAYEWTHEAMRWKGGNPILILSDSGFDEAFGLKMVAGESTRTFDAKTAMRAEIERVNKQKGRLGDISKKAKSDDVFERQFAAFESMAGLATKTTHLRPQLLEMDLSKGFGDILRECEKFFEHKQVKVKFHEQLKAPLKLGITDNEEILRIPTLAKRVVRESMGIDNTGRLERAYEGPTMDQKGAGVKPEDENLQRERLKLTDLAPGKETGPEAVKTYVELPKLNFGQSNRLDYTEIALPPGSTIPVVMGGDVRNPIGWLTIIDDLGNFVSDKSTMYGDMNFYNYVNDSGMSDATLNRAYAGLGHTNIAPEIANRLNNRFGELAEDYFTTALGEAMGGVELDVQLTETFVKVLLSRHLGKRHSQVLYIPAENLAYFATSFDTDGFGVSLPERSFVISTVRMAMLFAHMNSSVLNASRFMQYDIQLSPDDMNPQETIDRIKTDIMNHYNRPAPQWGNMDDAWAMASNANIAFNVEGNQHYSSHKVSVSDTTPEYKSPDMDFDNELLRRTARLAWVDPDLVLNPENIEFASQIFSKSLIMSAQIQAAQETLSVPLSQYVRAGIKASPKLQAQMLEELVKEMGIDINQGRDDSRLQELNGYIQAYTAAVKVTIPPPDTSAAASQMELFDKRVEFIDKIVDTVMTDAMINRLSDSGLKFQGDELKAMVRGYYLSNWMSNQGMETDLLDLMTDPDKMSDTVTAISDQNKAVFNMMTSLAKRTDSKLESVANAKGLGEGEDAGGEFGAETETGAEGTGDDTGLDDGGLDMGDDLSGDDLNGDDLADETEKQPDDESSVDENPGDENAEGNDPLDPDNIVDTGAGQNANDAENDPLNPPVV